jgi:MraZ protein
VESDRWSEVFVGGEKESYGGAKWGRGAGPQVERLLDTVESLKGRDERSLDPKSRVIVPQRYRSFFAPEGVLAPHEDGCIALWTTAEFGEESLRQHIRSKEGPAAGHEVRRWFSMCSEFSLDQQGRMIVPPGLREYAQLTTEVLFFGVFDRVELWSKQMWEARDAAFGSTGS